jgi:tripartite-type tricarboxylate transporter receptor subunit TctC
MPFDPQKDFAPISLLGTTALALVVHPSVPANNVRELIDLARKGPGRLNYASSGNGSPQHMSAEMFKAMTKTSMTHIPYRGAAPAVNDLLAGQVQVTIGVVNQLIPHIRAGKLKALGVTTRKRLAQMPDVPTLDEAGVPGYESEIWLGLAAPSATPPAIIEQINQAIRKAMATADVISKLQSQGIDVVVSSPDQMRQRGLEDLKRWGDIIRTAGIKVD